MYLLNVQQNHISIIMDLKIVKSESIIRKKKQKDFKVYSTLVFHSY